MKSVGTDEFFKLVATNSGISDLSVVRDVFYGMVKTLSRELRAKQTVKMPDWGEFVLKVHKSRKFIAVDGKAGILPPKPTVKFVPDYKVKKYFYALGDEGTMIK